jgi:hypothetical protein
MVGGAGEEIPGEASVRRHDLEPVARLQIIRGPVGEDAAGDALHRDLHLAVLGRDAERVVAAHLLAADLGLEGEVLARLELERLAQLGRHVEADRGRLGGFGHDLGDAEAVEADAHSLRFNDI